MSERTSQAWPPPNGLTTVNVPRDTAILSMYGSARINAPAKQVFDTVLDIANYERWNHFCPKVTVQAMTMPDSGEPPSFDPLPALARGTIFTFYVIMNAKKPGSTTPTQLKVTDISEPEHPSTYVSEDLLTRDSSFTADLQKVYRVSWKCEGGFVTRGLQTERFHEIIALGENECEVRTWECQGGILAHTVKWMYKQTLMSKFQMWCEDLKAYCEQERTAQ